MEKEFEKELLHVYVELSYFAVYLKLTQHCSSTMLQNKFFFKSGESMVDG